MHNLYHSHIDRFEHIRNKVCKSVCFMLICWRCYSYCWEESLKFPCQFFAVAVGLGPLVLSFFPLFIYFNYEKFEKSPQNINKGEKSKERAHFEEEEEKKW